MGVTGATVWATAAATGAATAAGGWLASSAGHELADCYSDPLLLLHVISLSSALMALSTNCLHAAPDTAAATAPGACLSVFIYVVLLYMYIVYVYLRICI